MEPRPPESAEAHSGSRVAADDASVSESEQVQSARGVAAEDASESERAEPQSGSRLVADDASASFSELAVPHAPPEPAETKSGSDTAFPAGRPPAQPEALPAEAQEDSRLPRRYRCHRPSQPPYQLSVHHGRLRAVVSRFPSRLLLRRRHPRPHPPLPRCHLPRPHPRDVLRRGRRFHRRYLILLHDLAHFRWRRCSDRLCWHKRQLRTSPEPARGFLRRTHLSGRRLAMRRSHRSMRWCKP